MTGNQASQLNLAGETYLQDGNIDLARSHFEKAISCDPDFAEAYNNLACAYMLENDYNTALKHITKAYELDQNSQSIVLNTGSILANLGSMNDSLLVFRSYLENNPGDSLVIEKIKELERTDDQVHSVTASDDVAIKASPAHDKIELFSAGKLNENMQAHPEDSGKHISLKISNIANSDTGNELKDRYLELLINCLTDNILKIDDISDDWRKTGGKNYKHAYTMTGLTRMKHTRLIVETLLNDGIEGDLVETGIWRGGQTILMQAILKLYGSDKKVFACDSFEGLPPPDPKYQADAGDIHHTFDHLKVSKEQVMNTFIKFDLLYDNVIFLEGWFEETTKDKRIEKIAFLRLDGDMYSSTIQVLDNLYHKVSIGGFVVIDDWTLPGARKAVADFRSSHGIVDDIYAIHSKEEMAAINEPESFSSFWVKQS